MHYNLDYALRVCTQNRRIQSCVNIYSSMGLYGEAVDLALKVSYFKITCFQNNVDFVKYKSLAWNS